MIKILQNIRLCIPAPDKITIDGINSTAISNIRNVIDTKMPLSTSFPSKTISAPTQSEMRNNNGEMVERRKAQFPAVSLAERCEVMTPLNHWQSIMMTTCSILRARNSLLGSTLSTYGINAHSQNLLQDLDIIVSLQQDRKMKSAIAGELETAAKENPDTPPKFPESDLFGK